MLVRVCPDEPAGLDETVEQRDDLGPRPVPNKERRSHGLTMGVMSLFVERLVRPRAPLWCSTYSWTIWRRWRLPNGMTRSKHS